MFQDLPSPTITSVPKQHKILVVGAGPTGLACANALVKEGVSVRIIDQASARSDKSKALGVHAGTLEAFDSVFGPAISEEMIRSGFPTRQAMIHIGKRPSLRVNLDTIPSRHNFILILEQSETERILEEHLSSLQHHVERRSRLLSLENLESSVKARIDIGNGGIEEAEFDYVIGCDGAHSQVRESIGIPFVGKSYEGEFILGDIKMSWPWEYGAVRNFVTDQGVMASFPMRGERRYRLILIQSKSLQSSNSSITLEEFQKIAQAICPEKIELTDPTWLTRFRVHRRMVSEFRRGRVFLAGDAAHIHSPAGGQGMNTGIQDGLNLAHKLSQVLVKHRSPKILDHYQCERLPVAKAVTRGTDFFFKLALLKETPTTNFLRSRVFPKLVNTPFLQKTVVHAISEVGIARKEMMRRQKEALAHTE